MKFESLGENAFKFLIESLFVHRFSGNLLQSSYV